MPSSQVAIRREDHDQRHHGESHEQERHGRPENIRAAFNRGHFYFNAPPSSLSSSGGKRRCRLLPGWPACIIDFNSARGNNRGEEIYYETCPSHTFFQLLELYTGPLRRGGCRYRPDGVFHRGIFQRQAAATGIRHLPGGRGFLSCSGCYRGAGYAEKAGEIVRLA